MNPSTLFFLKPVLSILVLSLCHMNSRIQLASVSRKGSWNVVGVGLAHTSAGGASLSSNATPSRLQAFLHIVSYSLFIWVCFVVFTVLLSGRTLAWDKQGPGIQI